MQIKVYQVYLYSRCSLIHLHSMLEGIHVRNKACTHTWGDRKRQKECEERDWDRDERHILLSGAWDSCMWQSMKWRQTTQPQDFAHRRQTDRTTGPLLICNQTWKINTPSLMQCDLQAKVGRNNPVWEYSHCKIPPLSPPAFLHKESVSIYRLV